MLVSIFYLKVAGILAKKRLYVKPLFLQIGGVKYLYSIGGWNLAYLNSVHRMKLDNSTGEPISGSEQWFQAPSMIQERSDHACAVAQFGWEYGIIVAGIKTAWLGVIFNPSVQKKTGREEQ